MNRSGLPPFVAPFLQLSPRNHPRSDRLRFKPLVKPRPDAPLPLWMIFPVIFAGLYASHFTLLRLPYYWDEAGYYIDRKSVV